MIGSMQIGDRKMFRFRQVSFFRL